MNAVSDCEQDETVSAASADQDAPLFLTGFARSGTTWANSLFRDYFDAGFVNEGQFILSFGRRLSRYGNLEVGAKRRRLILDLQADPFFGIVSRNYAVDIDWQRIWETPPNFPAMVIEILKQIANQTGKRRIGSKNPAFGWHLGILNELFPKCRVVHIIRDGRDCALSHRRLRWGHQNTYAAAAHWRDYLRGAQSEGRRMGRRYLELRYEDLLAQPKNTMQVLEEFVTGSTDGTITARFMREAASLKTDNVFRWRTSMTPAAQALFEGVAGEVLKQACYPVTGLSRPPTLLMRGLYVAHNRVTREAWHYVRKVFPAIPEQITAKRASSATVSPARASS
jgi:hypothetical protein